MKRRAFTPDAFTLIELLIVVAIIAVLAAIAVPNFLEAQTRAKVSRVKADLRSVATAIEAYAVDEGQYPRDGDDIDPFNAANFNAMTRLAALTTPVSYMTSVPYDPFHPDTLNDVMISMFFPAPPYPYLYLTHGGYLAFPPYTPANYGRPDNWRLISFGPDTFFDAYSIDKLVAYDPSNGTVSTGDIFRFGGAPVVVPSPTP